MSGFGNSGPLGSEPKFRLVDQPADLPPQPDLVAQANTRMLLLALSSLSKRALTAITNLFTLGLVASAWWLWDTVLPNPSWTQLAGVAGYALFCLLIEIVRRRHIP